MEELQSRAELFEITNEVRYSKRRQCGCVFKHLPNLQDTSLHCVSRSPIYYMQCLLMFNVKCTSTLAKECFRPSTYIQVSHYI